MAVNWSVVSPEQLPSQVHCKQSIHHHPQVTTKKCRSCSEDKSADDFFRSKVNVDGLYSYCKTCATKLNSKSKKTRRDKRKVAKAGARTSADSDDDASGAVQVESQQALA